MPNNGGKFDEHILAWALSSRPEDARMFARIFRPNWARNPEITPILSEIYAFTKKHGVPPSLSTLRKIFRDRDEGSYQLRYSRILDEIEGTNPDLSSILYTLDRAKDAAIVHSLQELMTQQQFLRNQTEYEGKEILSTMHAWMQQFLGMHEDRTVGIKDAIEELIQSRGFNWVEERTPCGIPPIDRWTDGGLKAKQMGVILAPTGHGKSFCAVYMSHWMAAVEDRDVWVVSNEMDIDEISERYLSRLTGVEMTRIKDDPILGSTGIARHWSAGLDKKLLLSYFNREVTMDDIEAEMGRWVQMKGWKPQVVFIDYMGRMKPNSSGYSRDQEWKWIGGVAGDIVRFAKRNNILVWTFAQTNRSGLTAPVLNMEMAQGSIQHLQEAAAVVGVNQISIGSGDDRVMGMQFRPLKLRHSRRADESCTLRVDLARMTVSGDELETPEFEVSDKANKKQWKRKKSGP